MNPGIPIQEVKCHLAIGFNVKGTVKFFNTLNVKLPEFSDLEMTLEGDRLHVKTGVEEYFIWSANLIYAKPFAPKPVNALLSKPPEIKASRKSK